MNRRNCLKSIGSTGALAAALSVGLLKPDDVLAAEWNKVAFDAKDLASAVKSVGGAAAVVSKDLLIEAPEIAENGAVTPVEIISKIPNTTSISIFVEKNPSPLSVHVDFANGALPEVSARLKMGHTSIIKAVAKADGKFYSATKEIKVTAGGCGG